MTDSTGTYRIPQLAPGVYALRFEKESYRPLSRSGLELRSGITARADVELFGETTEIKEEVVVVGRPPTIDVGSSTTGTSIGADFTNNVAVSRPGGRGGSARSFDSLAALAPQAQDDGFGVSINGSSSPENSYQIDGVSVNNPGYGINGTPLSLEFMDEVNILTGGYLPEYGRTTGGTVTAVTKSGGNEFHGSIWGNLNPGQLNGTPHPVTTSGSTFSATLNPWFIGDFGADIGGYILKDKLWFYAGLAPNFQRYKFSRSLNSVDPDTGDVTAIPNSTTARFVDQKSIQYIGKLTYLFNQDHKISLTVTGTPTTSGSQHSWGFDPQTGASESGTSGARAFSTNEIETNSSSDVVLKLSDSFLEKKFLLDTTLGWHHQDVARNAQDGSTTGGTTGLAGQSVLTYLNGGNLTDYENLPSDVAAACAGGRCPTTAYTAGGPGFLESTKLDSYQLKVVGTYLLNALGHHVIKAGFDGDFFTYNHTSAYSGGSGLQTTDGVTWVDTRLYGWLTGPDQYTIAATETADSNSFILGGFVQDSWSIADLITLNVGVRYDAQSIYGGDGKLGMSLPNQWSPRAGLIYDFTQKGKSKIFVNYSRYYENIPLDLADRELPGQRQLEAFHTGAGGSTLCDPLNNPGSCRDPATYSPHYAAGPNNYWVVYSGDATPVDPNIKPSSSDEIVAGAEYEIFANARLGGTYTNRWLNTTIEDMSNDQGASFFLANPGYGIASNIVKATRQYQAGTIYLTKSFADLWLLQVSGTLSRLYGNYEGLVNAGYGQLDPNITAAFDVPQLRTANQTGLLAADHTWSFKAYGAKEFVVAGPVSITLGLTYTATSGTPTGYYGADLLYGTTVVPILPQGSGVRTPWVHDIDAHLAANFRLSKDSVLSANVDVFNLANFQAALATDQDYTYDPVNPIINGTVAQLKAGTGFKNEDGSAFSGKLNPNFGNATQYQATRTFRFGVKLTY